MDGRNRKVITSTMIERPSGVAVDVETGSVYWLNYDRDDTVGSGIFRYTFNGAVRKLNIDHRKFCV